MPSRTTLSATGAGLAAALIMGLAAGVPALRAQDAGPSLLPAGEPGTPLHVASDPLRVR